MNAWPNSWNDTETTSTNTYVMIHRICSGERSTRPGTMAFPECACKWAISCAMSTAAVQSGMARRLRLDEAADLFLDHVKVERGLAVHTLDGYGRDLARLVAFLSDRGHED